MKIILLLLQLIILSACQTSGETQSLLEPNKEISDQDEYYARNTHVESATSAVTRISSSVNQFDFTLILTKETTVNGCTPTVTIDIGGTDYTAVYKSGSGTKNHVYQVSFNSNTVDSDGPTIKPPLDFPDGCLIDASNKNAVPDFETKSIKTMLIDQLGPTASSFVVTTSNGTIYPGAVVTIKANLSEVSKLSGTSTLPFTINGNSRTATYVSGNNSTSFTFTYTITNSDVGTSQFIFGNQPTNIKDSFDNNGRTPTSATSKTIIVGALDKAPVSRHITPMAFDEDTSSIITLDYSDDDNDQASACSVSAASNIVITQACACNAGICTVGVRGNSNHFGAASFSYSVTARGANSNVSTATLSINSVDDEPVVTSVTKTFNEDEESIITISYSDVENDLATSCSASNLNKVNVTKACTCTTGVCTIGVTGHANYNGNANFNYSIFAN